jgi:signal transduction histidine kinase
VTGNFDDDERALRSAVLLNAESILQARYKAEHELVSAKEALGHVADRLRLALGAGQLGDWSWDAATDQVTLGDRAAEIFDLPVGAVITWKKMREILHEDDRERARLAVEDSLLSRTDYDIDYRVVHSSGAIRWVSAKGRGVYGIDGQVRGMSGVVLDITDRKRTEDALKDETRMLEILNGTAALLSGSLELPVLVQAVTDAATALSGAEFGAFFYNTTDETGEAFLLFALSGAPREAFERFGNPRNTEVFGPTFAGEGVIRLDDVLADPRYGKLAPHYGMPKGHLPVRSYLAAPVIARNGEVIGGLFFGHSVPGVFTARTERLITGVAAQAAVAIDNARLYEDARRIAEQREKLVEAERAARAEAERVSQMKDEFLATLSHELRTPLNAILGWSQLLLSRAQGDVEAKRGLETIARNARAQTQLIDDLLDMSRIISGKVRLELVPTELGEVVDAAMEAVSPSADVKGITLHKVSDPSAGSVMGDPNRLQQVVWNLLTNAVKFTSKGGRVDVTVRRVGAQVELVVRDTGRGIDAAFLPHVFDRFRQADASSTRAHGGLGLGLSIVKQIVELHGGTTHAASEGEGRGAVFTVCLPVVTSSFRDRDHPSMERALSFEHTDVDLAGLRVLVVDDEADARELIELALTRCGASVLTAASAEEALFKLDRSVDVIVSDIGMPNADGYELIARVRALPFASGGRTPAVALTAFARSEDRTRAMLAGFQLHIAKPIEPRELVVTVGSLAGRTFAG